MSGYNLALFLHIAGVVALFGDEASLLVALGGSRRTQSVQALREWAALGAVLARLLPIFALFLLAPAAYMVSDRWGWKTQWVNIALVGLIISNALGPTLIEPRLKRLAKAAREAPEGPVPLELRRLALDPLMWVAGQVLTTVGTGIIVLMVFKPTAGPAILVMLVAAALGLLSGVPALARFRRLDAAAGPGS